MRMIAVMVVAGLAFAVPASGHTARSADEISATGPSALHAGEIHFANSGSRAAQKPFLEGLALLHDFEYERAAVLFQQAQAIDPGFAMAYWGEAMTHNHAVWMEQDLPAARAALAKLGPTPQARSAKAPTQREKDYLGAIEVLYGDGTKEERDFRYADAMAVLHAKYPNDVDATAFYALSLLGTAHEGRDFAIYMKSAALLEDVYPTHMRHPGVLHYMIHSYDDPIHAPLGLRAARRYGVLAPDAPHALHMTSHIFLALGMWDEVIEANRKAIAAGNALRMRAGKPPKHCGHYFTWLTYAELQERRDADAQTALAECRLDAAASLGAPTPYDPDSSAVGSYVYMRLLQIVETGHAEKTPRLVWPASADPSADFFAAYGDAVTALRADDAAGLQKASAVLSARRPAMLALLVTQGNTSKADRQNVDIIVDEMAAAAKIRAGDSDGGLAALHKVAEDESQISMEFGPPIVALPSWELLGEELLRAQKPAEAAKAFRNALARAPGRTQSLKGLLKSEELLGNASGTAAVKIELQKYRRDPG